MVFYLEWLEHPYPAESSSLTVENGCGTLTGVRFRTMKSSLLNGLLFAATAFGLCTGAGAQSTTPQATQHAPDGGVRETLQSIDVPTLTNAPFSANVETEWTKIMPDGTTATQKNHRTIARDSSGRVFQERRYFAPNGDNLPTQLSQLEYMDPNRHEFYTCIPLRKTCYVSQWTGAALTAMPAGTNGLRACGCATTPRPGMSVQNEALGQKTIEDIDVIGSREVTTIAAGQIGNEKAEPIVKEFWYSPRLGINVVTKRFDPRSGMQNFVVDNIARDEPDPKLFEPPADYQVVRQVVERPGLAQVKP
jgi:hypothetical protein